MSRRRRHGEADGALTQCLQKAKGLGEGSDQSTKPGHTKPGLSADPQLFHPAQITAIQIIPSHSCLCYDLVFSTQDKFGFLRRILSPKGTSGDATDPSSSPAMEQRLHFSLCTW